MIKTLELSTQQALFALCGGDADTGQQLLVYREFVRIHGQLYARDQQLAALRKLEPIPVRVAKDSLERVPVYPAIEVDALTHNACNSGRQERSV